MRRIGASCSAGPPKLIWTASFYRNGIWTLNVRYAAPLIDFFHPNGIHGEAAPGKCEERETLASGDLVRPQVSPRQLTTKRFDKQYAVLRCSTRFDVCEANARWNGGLREFLVPFGEIEGKAEIRVSNLARLGIVCGGRQRRRSLQSQSLAPDGIKRGNSNGSEENPQSNPYESRNEQPFSSVATHSEKGDDS